MQISNDCPKMATMIPSFIHFPSVVNFLWAEWVSLQLEVSAIRNKKSWTTRDPVLPLSTSLILIASQHQRVNCIPLHFLYSGTSKIRQVGQGNLTFLGQPLGSSARIIPSINGIDTLQFIRGLDAKSSANVCSWPSSRGRTLFNYLLGIVKTVEAIMQRAGPRMQIGSTTLEHCSRCCNGYLHMMQGTWPITWRIFKTNPLHVTSLHQARGKYYVRSTAIYSALDISFRTESGSK